VVLEEEAVRTSPDIKNFFLQARDLLDASRFAEE